MPWNKRNPDLTNDPSYLEPRITTLEKTRTSKSTYGLVKVGEGLNVSDGVISADIPGMTASGVSIEDAEGNFTAPDVEGALRELFTNVSNGKELIATAITDKNVPTSSSDSFQTMANNIELLTPYNPYDDKTDAPGNKMLVVGNLQAGYFGVTPSTELIDGSSLASLIGLSRGTAQHTEEGWLKFSLNGQILFVAKKPIRSDVSWDDINLVGAVTGDKTVEIKGLNYKVRLLTGNGTETEWNRLILPIHEKAPSNWIYPEHAGVTEDWDINFTDEDLLTLDDFGNGSFTWCQERNGSAQAVYRGRNGVSYLAWYSSSSRAAWLGWRPVLELVTL